MMSTGVCLSAVSLPSATADLGLSSFVRSASAASTSLAIAATAVAAGVAADRLGRRRVLQWSYLLAAAACLAIVLIPSGAVYLAGNFLAGVAYGVMLTATYALVKVVAPPAGLGKALGLWGMYSIVFATAGSLAGGVLADVDWRWLFLVVPAMCALSALLTPRLLPRTPRIGSGPVDVPGLALIGLGLAAVISGLLAVASAPGEPPRMGARRGRRPPSRGLDAGRAAPARPGVPGAAVPLASRSWPRCSSASSSTAPTRRRSSASAPTCST